MITAITNARIFDGDDVLDATTVVIDSARIAAVGGGVPEGAEVVDGHDGTLRADARKNYDHLLVVAEAVVREQGADASLREVARRAGVGLATLYRHFPTREALLEALLRASFDELAAQAVELATASSPHEALVSWLRDCVSCATEYRGLTEMMVTAIEDPASALHASCVAMRAACARLLRRAQVAGTARSDLDGTELFALVGALAWFNDQPALAPRADHLFDVIVDAILP